MADFPTIFDWLDSLSFMRGMPAAYLTLITALIIVTVWDWRVAILALTVQYFAAGLLFVDVLDPRLAIVKLLVGWFICLILYFTARQANWGRLPEDVTPAEAIQLRRQRILRFGPFLLPSSTPFRVFLGLMVALVVVTLSQRAGYRLPAVSPALNLAIFSLTAMGLLGVSLTTEPLRAGLGLLMFLTGFEFFYNSLEQSVLMLAFLAVTNLALTLAISYLTQTRHALAALFTEHEI